MSLEIRQIKSHRDLHQFVKFHYHLYKGNSFWVPPLFKDEMNTLSSRKNPAFEFCQAAYWVALKQNQVVGRIAAFINHRYIQVWNSKDARFGWFDFIDDEEVSAALLTTAEEWARQQGMEHIHGPLGFTDFDAEGLLIEGFDQLSTFGAGYNYPYYARHLEQNGWAKDIDYVEFQVEMKAEIPDKVARLAAIAEKRNNLTMLRAKNAKELLPYAHQVFELINDAYRDLYGFVPLSEKQIDLYIKQYFGFIRPDYVPVVLDGDGRVAAFGITMPSLSRAMQRNNGHLFPFGFWHVLKAMKNNPYADLYLTAVRRDLQNKGVNAMLIYEINKVFLKNKIQWVETNRELENNTKVQAQWRYYNARQHKRRRIYKKRL
ncbi:MAG: hypothetical protein EHM72_03180 [Calditrichaeota bacterium]|nr:MAG: hypothetical protein EHM72_03180 [Calditrichota bacterium]